MTLDAPYHAHDYGLLLDLTKRILAERATDYPVRVSLGKMTQEQADDGLRIAGSIVADWQRVVDLREGREPAALDATATSWEKRNTLAYVHERAGKQLAKAAADLRPLLEDIGALEPFEWGLSNREGLRAAWKLRYKGWPHPEIHVFLTTERRTWLTEALLWHADRWPLAMLYAELQAELIVRDRAAAAA